MMKKAFNRFTPNKEIFIDVDGTLIIHGEVNEPLVVWIERRFNDGYTLTLWSARGEQYAKEIAEQTKTTHFFKQIISKPSYIVDDQGWKWTRYVNTVTNLNG